MRRARRTAARARVTRVQYASRARAPRPRAIAQWARAALAGMRRARVCVGVRIVNRAESAALNRRYRSKPEATNVLAFAFDAPAGVDSDILGDLVICASVVNREARALDKPFAAHWAHIVVHGIMHLRGFDHQSRRDAAVMERKEATILKRLGFADPYA